MQKRPTKRRASSEPTPRELAEALETYRLAKRLTYQELADELGLKMRVTHLFVTQPDRPSISKLTLHPIREFVERLSLAVTA